MTLCFTLSMPRNNAWNGKWSGEGRGYYIVKSLTSKRSAKILATPYHSYDFGDGWRAGVSIREVTPAEAKKLRKASAGFCGYDWMVDEILTHGRIKPLSERGTIVKEEPAA